MRVSVQFVATSAMGPAIKDIQRVNAQLATLAAEMKAIGASPVMAGRLQGMQRGLVNEINSMKGFETHSVRTRTITQQLTDDIIKQRIAMKDLGAVRKNLPALTEQQMRLQQSSAMITGRSPDGRVQGQLIQPTQALGTAAQKAAVSNGILGQSMISAGQAAVRQGKNMQWTGRQMQNGFTMPLLLAAGAAAKFAYDIDAAMVRLTKVYGDTAGASEKELSRVREATTETAKRVAREFGIAGEETVAMAADFAAAGQQGEALQTATYQTSRIAMLGELERQQAMKATIAVQTVFGISSDQLAEKFNFLNAVENQTNTTLQDLVEAIPRVAGTIKSLGGSLEDSAIFTVAFKEAGITAAQGANALRSSLGAIVAPSQVARKVLKGMGIDIQEIVNNNAGNLMETLKALGAELEGMSGPERQRALATLFGRYQFNKMDQLIIGLTKNANNMNSQVGRAFALAGASVTELAEVADREEKDIAKSLSGRLVRTLRTIQLEMADFGRPILAFFTVFMEGIGFLVKALNSLPGPIKVVAALLAGAFLIAGPLIRLGGLFKMLYGSTFAFAGMLVKSRGNLNQMLTASGMFAKHAQAAVIPELAAETNAFALLATQIQRTAGAMAMLAAEQRVLMASTALGGAAAAGAAGARVGAVGGIGGATTTRTRRRATRAAGAPTATPPVIIPATNAAGRRVATRAAGPPPNSVPPIIPAAGANSINDAAKNAGKLNGALATARANMTGIASGALLAGGMIGVMAGGTNKWVMGLSMGALLLASIPGLLGAIGHGLTKIWGLLAASRVVAWAKSFGMVARLGPIFVGLGTSIAAMTGPLLIVAAAIGLAIGAWKLYQRHLENARKSQEAVDNTARSMAQAVGYAYTKAGQYVAQNGEVTKTLQQQAKEWSNSSDQAKEATKAIANATDAQARQMAMAAGYDARTHGATAENAYKTVQLALTAAGKQELLIGINMSDFQDEAEAAKIQMEAAGKALAESFDKGGADGVRATQMLKDLGKQLAVQIDGTDLDAAYEGFSKIRKEIETQLNKELQGITLNQESIDYLKKFNVDPNDLVAVNDFVNTPELREFNRPQQLQQLEDSLVKVNDKQRVFVQSIAEELGVTDEAASKLNTLNDLFRLLNPNYVTADQATKGYNDAIGALYDRLGSKVTPAMELATLNIWRMKRGLGPATDVAQGFAESVEKVSEKTTQMARDVAKANVGAEEFASAFKTNLTDNISRGMEEILTKYDENTEAYGKTLDTQNEMWSEAQDERKRVSDDEFEDRKRKLDADFDTESRKMDDRHETELETAEALKEAQVDAINKQIEAAEKLDEKRQQMFDAEITRIKRLAEAANRNIDFNIAIRGGNLDEAARVFEAGYVEDVSANMEDATVGTETIAETRKTDGEERIKRITDKADANIDGIRDRQEDEKRAFETSKDLRRQQLEDEKEMADLRFTNEKKLHDKNLQLTRERYTKQRAEVRKALDEEMRKRAEDIPITKEMYQGLFNDLISIQKKHTGDATIQSREWTRLQMTGFDNAWKHTREQLSNQAVWKTIGEQSIEGLTGGILGMSFKDFANWMTTGKLPEPKAPAGPVSPANKPGGSVYNSQVPAQARHGGGPIGPDKFNNRAGRSANAPLRAGEVPIIAQTGEFVFKRDAVDRIGMDNLHALNQGKMGPDNTGRMHEGGIVGTVGAGIMGTFQEAMKQAIYTGAQRKSRELAAEGNYAAIPAAFADTFGKGYTPGTAGKYGGTVFSEEQLANAAAIVSTGKSMGASDRDVIIGLMTAMQESMLKNINYGDAAGPDSRGLFQQRDSWGPLAVRMNPSGAARLFFQQLLAVKGREELPLTLAAQKVQRSAHPEAYAKWEDEARAILAGGVVAGQPIGVGAEALGTGTIGGTGGRGVDSTGDLIALLQKSGLPFRISSRYRPGARTHASGNLSYHATANAIDVAGPRSGVDTPEMLAINRYFAKFGRGLKELIYSGPGAINLNNGRPYTYSGVTAADHHDHVHVAATKDSLKSLEIPGLKVGGTVNYDNTLANLHKGETVLTAPLSQALDQGIRNMDNSTSAVYNINVNGAPGQSVTDLARAVRLELEKTEVRKGINRRIS